MAQAVAMLRNRAVAGAVARWVEWTVGAYSRSHFSST